MILWIVELLFWLVLMTCIEEIGLWGACAVCILLNVISAAVVSATLGNLFTALVTGFITGIIVYVLAKLGLWIVRALGTLGFFLIGLFFVLAIIAIIA